MRKFMIASILSIATIAALSTAVWADWVTVPGHSNYPFLYMKQAAPPAVKAIDTDGTGYPNIQAWKYASPEVSVFLNDAERDRVTAARVQYSHALKQIFFERQMVLRRMLTPGQYNVFESIVPHQDMAKLADMSKDDWTAYNVCLSQKLHLDGHQQAKLTAITDKLISDIAPVQQQYTAIFNQVVADAAARTIAERELRSRMIGTPPQP